MTKIFFLFQLIELLYSNYSIIMLENTKLALSIYHLYNAASHIILFSTIFLFFRNSYMSLSLFLFLLNIMLVGRLKIIIKFFGLSKFLFMLKIFWLCNIFIAFYVTAFTFCNLFSSLTSKDTLISLIIIISPFYTIVLTSFLHAAFMVIWHYINFNLSFTICHKCVKVIDLLINQDNYFRLTFLLTKIQYWSTIFWLTIW